MIQRKRDFTHKANYISERQNMKWKRNDGILTNANDKEKMEISLNKSEARAVELSHRLVASEHVCTSCKLKRRVQCEHFRSCSPPVSVFLVYDLFLFNSFGEKHFQFLLQYL